jgi:hypothetical protein
MRRNRDSNSGILGPGGGGVGVDKDIAIIDENENLEDQTASKVLVVDETGIALYKKGDGGSYELVSSLEGDIQIEMEDITLDEAEEMLQ